MADTKKRGKITLEEYLALAKKNKKSSFEIPPAVKIALVTPFIIIFFFGLFYIPFMLFIIATSKPAVEKETKEGFQVLKKDTTSDGASSQ